MTGRASEGDNAMSKAKKKPKTPVPKDDDRTPFQRFEALARRVVNAPKPIRESKHES
jgi:hypothetical protein